MPADIMPHLSVANSSSLPCWQSSCLAL